MYLCIYTIVEPVVAFDTHCECNLSVQSAVVCREQKKNELCNDEFICWTNERMLFDAGYDTIRYNGTTLQ